MGAPIQVVISFLEIEKVQIPGLETKVLCIWNNRKVKSNGQIFERGQGGKEKSGAINSDWDQVAYRHRFYSYYPRFGGLLPRFERDPFQKPRSDRLAWLATIRS